MSESKLGSVWDKVRGGDNRWVWGWPDPGLLLTWVTRKGAKPSAGASSSRGFWRLETEHRGIRYPEKESKESLWALACRMLEAFYRRQEPGTEVVG